MKELNITGAEGIRILEIPKWGMAQNWLGTTNLNLTNTENFNINS